MKYLIDLTKNNFDRIDFTEAIIIDFFTPHILPDSLEFTIWGATILLDSMWNFRKDFLPECFKREDYYVSGIGTIKINGLKGGSIEVYPYEQNKNIINKTVCAKNHDGTDLIFNRVWNSSNWGIEYLWECVTIWPYGFCNLKLYSEGEISYEFDDKDIISADEFVHNPAKYRFES